MVANYYMVDDINLRKFMMLSSEEVFNIVYDDDDFPYCDIDKMWHALYFLISKKVDPIYDKADFLSYAKSVFLFGDEYIDGDFPTTYITNDNLKNIMQELENLNFDDFVFDISEFEKNEIYPNIWGECEKDLILSELEISFSELKAFYNHALSQNTNILVIIC